MVAGISIFCKTNDLMAYLYRHIRLDKNEPFYIGIGSDSNLYRAYVKNGRNKIWSDIYNNTDVEIEILLNDLSWEQAKEKEKEFISLYGRIDNNTGTLANLTNGGAGMLGFRFSENARKNMSIAQKNKPTVTEETRNKLSIAGKNRIGPWKGKKFTTEHSLKIKIGTTGVKKKTIECPHCGLVGGAPQMHQWHFNNCKLKNI
jgi:hypothetical protein